MTKDESLSSFLKTVFRNRLIKCIREARSGLPFCLCCFGSELDLEGLTGHQRGIAREIVPLCHLVSGDMILCRNALQRVARVHLVRENGAAADCVQYFVVQSFLIQSSTSSFRAFLFIVIFLSSNSKIPVCVFSSCLRVYHSTRTVTLLSHASPQGVQPQNGQASYPGEKWLPQFGHSTRLCSSPIGS